MKLRWRQRTKNHRRGHYSRHRDRFEWKALTIFEFEGKWVVKEAPRCLSLTIHPPPAWAARVRSKGGTGSLGQLPWAAAEATERRLASRTARGSTARDTEGLTSRYSDQARHPPFSLKRLDSGRPKTSFRTAGIRPQISSWQPCWEKNTRGFFAEVSEVISSTVCSRP